MDSTNQNDDLINGNSDDQLAILTMLQLSDSAFPTGGFSHSIGLEASHKLHWIKNEEEFKNFIVSALENTCTQSLPFVRGGYENVANIKELKKLDRNYEACCYNHVANRASTRQGRSLLDTGIKTFPNNAALRKIQNALNEDEIHAHFPVIFGCTCANQGLSLENTVTSFLFGVTRTVAASAVRLGIFGPIEAQRIQCECQKLIPPLLKKYQNLSFEDAYISCPILDIMQNSHDTLFSKLFYS